MPSIRLIQKYFNLEKGANEAVSVEEEEEEQLRAEEIDLLLFLLLLLGFSKMPYLPFPMILFAPMASN